MDRRLYLYPPAVMLPVPAFFPIFSFFHIVILLTEEVFVIIA